MRAAPEIVREPQLRYGEPCQKGADLSRELERMGGNQAGILILRREQVGVANVRTGFALFDREPGLLLLNERPNFVAFDVAKL